MAKKDIETKLEITTCDIKGIDRINIESLIRIVRGQQVMLDSDLAMLYGVETKALNQAVKRNINRFPADFMFQLTKEETSCSRSQFVTLNNDDALRSQIATLNQGLESLIRVIRGQQVMLDSDLAMLYGVETKRLNEQVKRNLMLRGIWRNPQTQ